MSAKLPVNGGIRGRLATTAGQSTAEPQWAVLEIPGKGALRAEVHLYPEDNSDLILQWMVSDDDMLEASKDDAVMAGINNAGRGEVEVLPPTVLSPGRHFFRIVMASPKRKRQANQAGAGQVQATHPYLLTATVIDPDPGLEQEPNNDRRRAGMLRLKEPRTGYIGWSQDSDWYELSLEDIPNDHLLRVDVSGVPNMRLGLRVLNKSQRDRAGRRGLVVVPENRVPWPKGQNMTVRDIAIEPDQLPYYAVVEPLRKGPGNARESYRIEFHTLAPSTPHEHEPNWRPSNATPLIAEQPVDGFLGHPTDWDVYRIDAESPMVATIVVSGVPGADLQLEHVDVGGGVLKTVNDAPMGGLERMTLLPVGPKPVYVRVSSKAYGYNVDYGYGISVSLEDARDREIEPNDDFAAAGRVVLPAGSKYKGHIHPRGDSDHFSFTVTAPTPDELRLMAIQITGIEGLRLAVDLFESDETPITRKGDIGAKNRRQIKHEFTPGRYIIRVREETGQIGNDTATYTIKVIDLGLVEVETEPVADPEPIQVPAP
jgi:hypothetical protein